MNNNSLIIMCYVIMSLDFALSMRSHFSVFHGGTVTVIKNVSKGLWAN